jgi:hypothetical protein
MAGSNFEQVGEEPQKSQLKNLEGGNPEKYLKGLVAALAWTYWHCETWCDGRGICSSIR